MADKEVSQAPFNMALNTLESIREWIDKIAELSIGLVAGQRVDPNEMIAIKYKMVKQLIMLSTPLLEEKQLEEIEKFYDEIKLQTMRVKSNGTWYNNIPQYTTKTDYDLDECVQGTEKALQETGHFMPGPDESSLF